VQWTRRGGGWIRGRVDLNDSREGYVINLVTINNTFNGLGRDPAEMPAGCQYMHSGSPALEISPRSQRDPRDPGLKNARSSRDLETTSDNDLQWTQH
jgi:hypothetical protein